MDWQTKIRWQMLLAAVTSLNDGDAKLAEFKDPAATRWSLCESAAIKSEYTR